MVGHQNVLIFGERVNGGLSPLTTQVMRIGKKLSAELGEEMHLLLLEGGIRRGASDGYGYGADKVYMTSDPFLENYMTDTYLQAMEQVVRELTPAIILFGQNDRGLDLAPRLAFRLKTGVTLDCVELKISSGKGLLEQIKPVFGGKAYAHYSCPEGVPQIASVREGAYDSADYDESKKGDVIVFPLALDASRIRTRFIKKERDEGQALALKLASANIVVSGGRGLRKKEGVELLQETSDLLDGAIAGSRPAVDYGWIPGPLQVGLTGKKVNPQLYIAVGISGALQHMAGCSKSKTIVAINSDESAPIFKLSDFGAVGDYSEVLKGFNEEVRRIKRDRQYQSGTIS